jgi:hypothetical protein
MRPEPEQDTAPAAPDYLGGSADARTTIVTTMGEHAGRYASSAGSQAESTTLRESPGGATRMRRYGGGHLAWPGREMSLPVNAAFAVSRGRSLTTGTPRRRGLGPNMVERTRRAVVERPAAVTATNLGQPLRRHETPDRFVKAR